LSLMTEFLGLAYFAELPAVLIDVQRTGPSTGMPTRTQQSDITSAVYASHGDTRQMCLFPSTPKECFDLTADAFDLAERLQTPIIILTDLDIGMNECLSEPLSWDEQREYDRGKVMDAETLDAIEKFGRYRDVDDDRIPWRTLPGTHPEKGAFFTRGTSRDEDAIYTEKGSEYEKNMQRLLEKWQFAPDYLPQPVIEDNGNALGVIHFGTSADAVYEALATLQVNGQSLDSLRLRAVPFHADVEAFINRHETVFVVEQNRDGQMRSVLINELGCSPQRLVSIVHFDGDPLSAGDVVQGINQVVGNVVNSTDGDLSANQTKGSAS